jgi:hypothetical protein
VAIFSLAARRWGDALAAVRAAEALSAHCPRAAAAWQHVARVILLAAPPARLAS